MDISDTLSQLKTRLRSALTRDLLDEDVVKLSLAGATREPYPIICILYGGRMAKEMRLDENSTMCAFGMSAQEYGSLFGVDATLRLSAYPQTAFDNLERDEEGYGETLQQLEAAMATTLVSERIAKAWSRPSLRCAASLSMRLRENQSALSELLGELPRNDLRRVDALQCRILDEDDESDAHLMCTCASITALSSLVPKK